MAKIKERKLSDYKPDAQNINKGSEYGSNLLGKSLQEVGLGRSVLADKNGVLIAGNKTVEKAAELGFEEVLEVETDGKTLVVVKRTDLDINSEAGAKMKILDNTVSKHNYVEDAEVMEAVCEEYHLDAREYGLSPFEIKPGVEEKDPFDDDGIENKNQYGVIVMCPDEGTQESVFRDLTNMGFTCKIVVT